jgi:hypothetical protein
MDDRGIAGRIDRGRMAIWVAFLPLALVVAAAVMAVVMAIVVIKTVQIVGRSLPRDDVSMRVASLLQLVGVRLSVVVGLGLVALPLVSVPSPRETAPTAADECADKTTGEKAHRASRRSSRGAVVDALVASQIVPAVALVA